jgi:hypothetical protein
MMEIQNNGIAVIDNAYSYEYCQKLIAFFKWSQDNHRTWDRRQEATESIKKDESCKLNGSDFTYGTEHSPLMGEFNQHFFDTHYKNYTDHFSVLNDMNRHGIISYKIQKTMPSEGYHVWHCEIDNHDRARRLGVYILYLNDVEEGGETEFLYLSQRVKPKTGRLLLFPAGYVHTHRGNPPLSGEKYIMTGWMEFV